MNYEYYYNNVPGEGPSRNNLIYTSLISEDKKIFCQWYHNDTEYHKGKNQVVDPTKMQEKWLREVNYITQMRNKYPDLVPTIIKIDLDNQKLFFEIDGPDFWEQASCNQKNYDKILPDWQDQMLKIFKAHKDLGLWKYSLHPSSYFIVSGKLKSINYFFTYSNNEPNFSLKDVESHIYITRQNTLKNIMKNMGYDWDELLPFATIQRLALESFSNNYPRDFIDKAIKLLNV
jgi:hypothetical protein